jgi:predicted ATPase
VPASWPGIVGRELELEAIGSFLDRDSAGASALVYVGEAGIGKTALWEEGVRLARDAGSRVVVARPSERESLLPYVALADLVEPLLAVDVGAASGDVAVVQAVLSGAPA